MVYLVHEAQRAQTATEIRKQVSESSRPWHLLTWEALIALQLELVSCSYSAQLATLLHLSLLAQAHLPPLEWAKFAPADYLEPPALPSAQALFEDCQALVRGTLTPDARMPSLAYLQGASLFWACRAGIDSPRLPFAYLNDEPSFPVLHDQIQQRARDWQRLDALDDHTRPLWQLGPVVPRRTL